MIIGLAGTLNAGKDSLANILAEKHGFLHVSTSDMIRQMKRMEYGDSPKAALGRNDPYIHKLRTERGPGFLIDVIYDDWQADKEKYPGGVIASGIRAIGEAERIHDLGGLIVFVDADPKVRYERSQKRLRDEHDQKTLEEFIASERSEIEVDPNDKAVQNLKAMKDMADIVIYNDGNSIETFQNEAEKALAEHL